MIKSGFHRDNVLVISIIYFKKPCGVGGGPQNTKFSSSI